MKTNNEIFDIVMARKDEYETQRTARNKRIAAAGAGVLVIAICVGIGVAALKGNTPVVKADGDSQSENSSVTPADSTAEQTGVSYAVTRPNDTTVGNEAVIFPPDYGSETTQTSKIYGGANVPDEGANRTGAPETKPTETTTAASKDGSGGVSEWSGGPMIPAVPAVTGAKPGVKVVGEKITDAEAKAYLAENTWVGSALAASGVSFEDISYSETGYCHVSYDGTEGKQLEVRQNFRDYLAYSDSGKLIAIITITKENGKLSASPAFGGPWFGDYAAFLKAHKGEKLLYVYAGWMEIVITPDGKCYNPQGSDVSAYMEGVENPYAYFYNEAATYTP